MLLSGECELFMVDEKILIKSKKSEMAPAPDFIRLKDIPGVAVYTRAAILSKYQVAAADSSTWFVGVQRKQSNEGRVAYINFSDPSKIEVTDYYVTCPVSLAPFISLWLNSSLGRWELDSDSGRITKSAIENIIFPNRQFDGKTKKLGLLEILSQLAYILVRDSVDNGIPSEIVVAANLYSYMASYAAMELVIPDEFKKEGVSIIDSWDTLVKSGPVSLDSGKLDNSDVEYFIRFMFSNNNEMMDNVNRMKYYNSILFYKCIDVLKKLR